MSESTGTLKMVVIGALALTVLAMLVSGEYTAAGVWFIAMVLIGEGSS